MQSGTKRHSASILFLLLVTSVVGAYAAPPPISAFARQEQISGLTISLDGRYVAYIASVNGQHAAFVMDLSNPGKLVPVLKPEADSNVDLTWCHWGNDTRLLCGFTAAVSTQKGITFHKTKMAAVDADGGNVKILMNNQSIDNAQFRDDVLDWTPGDPQTVLVQSVENRNLTGTVLTSIDNTPAIFKLDIYTGGLTRVMRAQPNIWDYRTDGNGEVRLGSGINGTKRIFVGRLLGQDEWRVLAKVDVFDKDNPLSIMRVIPGTNKAYATADSNGRKALWEIDLEDKAPPKLLFEHPQVDINGVEYERATGKLLGYWYDTDRPFFQYEDDRLGSVMRGINKALPNTFNVPLSYTEDFKKLVIHSTSDINPGSFHLFDATTRKMTELGKAYPELNSQTLARMRSIEYPAQDGTKIPGYLTVPLNVRAEKLPLIVMPHEGPIARSTWKFDFFQQFLASRGYAVLQMNFRGSSGYGSEWLYAAHQDWGGLTYSDITDGARWAIAEGIADPNRICIVGWDFGGYAALLGAVRNSDIYKCAASIAPISDLLDLLDYKKNFRNPDILEGRLGSDRTKLKEDSPTRHAKDIKIPVLLIHGTRDARAPFDQSLKMAGVLKSEKKPYKFVEIKEADHSFWRPAERETILTEVEEFLKANLGPGTTPQE